MRRDANNFWTSDAIRRGDIGAIQKRMLDDSGYIHERDFVGDTLLRTAIAFGNLELVRLFVKHGADPNIKVDDGYTCLLIAIESDAEESIPIVAELISAGADIHAMGTNGWTPLHMAAVRGEVEKASLLIAAGADVNRRTEIDASETPLMVAASTGQPSTIRLLLEHGADPCMRDTINNRTSLEIAENAAKGPDPDVVDYLKKENIRIDVDELFRDMDLPAGHLEMMKHFMKDGDMTQNYIDASNELIKTGHHSEVIRILTEYHR